MVKKAKEETKEVAVPEKAQLPANAEMLDMFASDAGDGNQNVNPVEDQALPFLSIVQSNSPQCKKNDGKYIEGAEEGDIFNTVTNKLYGDSVVVVPVGYERYWTEWIPRGSGLSGGFCGKHERNSGIDKNITRDEKNRMILPNGHEIVDTPTHYVLVMKEDGSFEKAVISMTSTQMKKSRGWNTIIGDKRMRRSDGTLFVPPRYAFKYKLSTKSESNAKGSWMGWLIEDAGPIIDTARPLSEQPEAMELYQFCKLFCGAIVQGTVEISQPEPIDVEPEAAEHNAY